MADSPHATIGELVQVLADRSGCNTSQGRRAGAALALADLSREQASCLALDFLRARVAPALVAALQDPEASADVRVAVSVAIGEWARAKAAAPAILAAGACAPLAQLLADRRSSGFLRSRAVFAMATLPASQADDLDQWASAVGQVMSALVSRWPRPRCAAAPPPAGTRRPRTRLKSAP
jgi:hypothetical protein